MIICTQVTGSWGCGDELQGLQVLVLNTLVKLPVYFGEDLLSVVMSDITCTTQDSKWNNDQ